MNLPETPAGINHKPLSLKWVRKIRDEYIFPRICRKYDKSKKIECERECYAMHSEGINSLAVI